VTGTGDLLRGFECNGDVTSTTTRWIALVQTLSSGEIASFWAPWFFDWNYSVVISASASVTRIEYLSNYSRNLISSPTVMQAFGQGGAVMFLGHFLQEVGSRRIWPPASQVQYEVIDHLARIVQG